MSAVSGVICADECGTSSEELTSVPIARFLQRACGQNGESGNATSCLGLEELGRETYDQCTGVQTGDGCVPGFHVIVKKNEPSCNPAGAADPQNVVNALFCERDNRGFSACGVDDACPDDSYTRVATLFLPGCKEPGEIVGDDPPDNARHCEQIPKQP